VHVLQTAWVFSVCFIVVGTPSAPSYTRILGVGLTYTMVEHLMFMARGEDDAINHVTGMTTAGVLYKSTGMSIWFCPGVIRF
jgi:hypothetical protein